MTGASMHGLGAHTEAALWIMGIAWAAMIATEVITERRKRER